MHPIYDPRYSRPTPRGPKFPCEDEECVRGHLDDHGYPHRMGKGAWVWWFIIVPILVALIVFYPLASLLERGWS